MIENRMVVDSEWEWKEKRRVVHECENCECEICEGDEYFEINGECYCPDCIKEFMRYA